MLCTSTSPGKRTVSGILVVPCAPLRLLCMLLGTCSQTEACVIAATWKGRAVAVKVMLASHGDHAGELESFRQEVRPCGAAGRAVLVMLWRLPVKHMHLSPRELLCNVSGPVCRTLLDKKCMQLVGSSPEWAAAREDHLPAGRLPGASPHLHSGRACQCRLLIQPPAWPQAGSHCLQRHAVCAGRSLQPCHGIHSLTHTGPSHLSQTDA